MLLVRGRAGVEAGRSQVVVVGCHGLPIKSPYARDGEHKESLPVLLTPREVASTLRVDLSTVCRWIDRGTICAVQFGGARHTPSAFPQRNSCVSLPYQGPLTRGTPGRPSCRRARSSRGRRQATRPPGELTRPCMSAWGDRPGRRVVRSVSRGEDRARPPSRKHDGTRLRWRTSSPAEATRSPRRQRADALRPLRRRHPSR